MTKFQELWVSEYLLYQCTMLIKIQSKGSIYCYCHFKVFFQSVITLEDLCLAINSDTNSPDHPWMFPHGQNYSNLCYNPACFKIGI